MKTLLHLSEMIFDQPHAILPEKLDVILRVLGPRLALDEKALDELSVQHLIGPVIDGTGTLTIGGVMPAAGVGTNLVTSWPDQTFTVNGGGMVNAPYVFIPAAQTNGDPQKPDDKPYRLTPEGVAIIPIRGTLLKRFSFLSAASGCATYQGLAAAAEQAIRDPGVKAVLFDIDSPGGTTHGCFELSSALFGMRGNKPMWAIANDLAASAAYALASACDRVYVTATGGVGSIGVFAVHIDQSGLDEKSGVSYTYMSAGAKKTDGNPHEPLSKSARADIQAEVDRQYEMFVACVARNRDISQKAVRNTEAEVFFGTNAVDQLADDVGTYNDVLQALIGRINTLGSKPVALPGIPDNNALNDATASQHGDVTEMEVTVPAIPPHKTATSDGPWSGPQAKKNLREGEDAAYYRKAYAFAKPDGDPKTKAGYTFVHHEVSSNGSVGAANIKGCQSSIGVLNGGRSGTVLKGADRRGTYNHVAAHLRDAKLEPAPLASYRTYIAGVLEYARAKDNAELHAQALKYLQAGDAEESADEEAIMAKKSQDEEMKKPDDDEEDDDDEKDAKDQDDDEEDDDDECDDDEKSRKSKDDKSQTRKGRRAEVKPMIPNETAKKIAALCTIAGAPELAAEYIAKDYPEEKVMELLNERRAKASEQPGGVTGFLTGEPTAAQGQVSVEQAIRQAHAMKANSGGTLTRYQALQQVLRSNPEIYEAYMDERDRVIAACPSGRGRILTEYVFNHQRRYMAQLGLSTVIDDVVRTRAM